MNNTQTQEKFQPPLPFDEQSSAHTTKRGRKRKHDSHKVRETSSELFEQIKKKRNRSYMLILSVLVDFDFAEPFKNLTSREILDVLKSKGKIPQSAEANRVRPRLTELLHLDCVNNPIAVDGFAFEKRVNGFPASYVWRITGKGRELLDCLTRLHTEGKR